MEIDAVAEENVESTDYSEYFLMEYDDIIEPLSQSTPKKRTNIVPINK